MCLDLMEIIQMYIITPFAPNSVRTAPSCQTRDRTTLSMMLLSDKGTLWLSNFHTCGGHRWHSREHFCCLNVCRRRWGREGPRPRLITSGQPGTDRCHAAASHHTAPTLSPLFQLFLRYIHYLSARALSSWYHLAFFLPATKDCLLFSGWGEMRVSKG